MINLAISEPGIPVLHTDLDQNPWLLNVQNGTVDLQTGDIRPHNRGDLITKLCPTKFNPDAKSYVWDRFLEGVFDGKQDLIDFMQRWCGYCLTGIVREQMLPIWFGSGANGKSTFIEAFMHAFGSDYAMKAPHDLFVVKKHNSHPTELADLFGKRFVAAVETGDGRRLNESLVKELTGGDSIRARRMKEDFWEFSPTHKAIICTNHKPQVRGNDHAIWRRLWLVPFTVKFWNPDKGETGPGELRQDKLLPKKLVAEAEGILAWAIRGCLDWQSHGISEPRDVLAATEEYRADENITERFISECCVTGQDTYVVRASALYDAYKKFCEETGEDVETQRLFGSKLTEIGYKRFTNNGTWYRRLTIRD
jgi:putative DNA primase/helicase